MRPEAWRRTRAGVASEADERTLAGRDRTVSVCVPALDEAEAIGETVRSLVALQDRGLVDEVIVVDGESTDGTGRLAREAGARVHDRHDLLPELGPIRGKGDALWRAQAAATGELLCFVDADLRGGGGRYVAGLVAPLLREPEVGFVKSAFDRPFGDADAALNREGGRVTRLAARPMLRLAYPDLLVFGQPLSGQVAIRSTLLGELPVLTGYAFDVGLLVEVYRRLGLAGIAEVHIGTLRNRHRDLDDLEQMAFEVALGVFHRLRVEGGPPAPGSPNVVERPPYGTVSAAPPPARQGTR